MTGALAVVPLRRAAKENLPVAKLAKSFGGQPKVLATSATVGMNSSAARLREEIDTCFTPCNRLGCLGEVLSPA